MVNTRAGKLLTIIIYILLAIVVSVIAKDLYTKQMQIKQLKREGVALDKRIKDMKQRISSIKRDIQMAKSDPHFIKHKAQDEFLMIGNDESIIIFHDGGKDDK